VRRGYGTREYHGMLRHLHSTAAVDELKSREASDSTVPSFPAGCVLLADAPSEDRYLGRAPPRSPVVCVAHTLGMENHAAPLLPKRHSLYRSILSDWNEHILDHRTRYKSRKTFCRDLSPSFKRHRTPKVTDEAVETGKKESVYLNRAVFLLFIDGAKF